jgi:limonene-1,2-epoxide hydrolase
MIAHVKVLAVLSAFSVGCAAATPVPMLPTPARCAEAAPPPTDDVVVARFSEAFDRHDFAAMACAYDPNVEFTDPVFGTLHGKRALAMWAMLTTLGKDLRVQASQIHTDDAGTHAHWDAHYTFAFLLFHNHVDNSVDATFELRGGKVVRHRDAFDLARWKKSALWPFAGAASDATLQHNVEEKLDGFIESHPEFQGG